VSETCRAYLQLLINTILPELHLVGLLYNYSSVCQSLSKQVTPTKRTYFGGLGTCSFKHKQYFGCDLLLQCAEVR